MFTTLRNAWRIADLRKKLLFTAFIIVLYRIGCTIVTVPFLDASVVQTFLNNNQGTLFGYLDILSGGAFAKATLFSLSISPYINAQIIMQLLTIGIPALEKLQKEEDGRKKIAQITRMVTIVIGLVTGFGYYRTLAGANAVAHDSFFVGIVIVMTFAAGSAILMWLGEQINDKGVGNGISIILFAGIVARGPAAINTLYQNFIGGTLKWWALILIVVGLLAVVAFIVHITDGERRIPIQYAKRVTGRKMYGGQSTYLPIKVNMNGVLPIIFALSMLQLPATIFTLIPQPKAGTFWADFLKQFTSVSPVYIILDLLLIFGFSYFYTAVQYNPIELANNIKNNGGFIPGIRPGKPTSDFITRILSKVTFFGAIFLALVAVVPMLFEVITKISLGLGGTTLLIVVGVAIETMKQIESQMLMRHYKGFLD